MNAIISRAKHTIWIDDVELYGKSWDAMLAVHPMRILPSHGNPFSPALLAKYRHFMEGGKVIPMKARKEKEPRG